MEFNDEGIIFKFLPEHLEAAKNFLSEYDLVNQDFITKGPIYKLKPENQRTCRFCGNSYPLVQFKQKAHTFPEFFGNKFSLSDYECDTCNKLFGEYEKQLFNFLGPFITLNGTKGKKKVPNSPSYDGKILAKKIKFFDAKKSIEIGSTENKSEKISFNKETNEYSIEFKLQPYIPIDVYKAFLKIGIGLFTDLEMKYFGLGLKVLKDKAFASSLKGEIFSIYIYSVSIPYEYTGVMLFKRKSKNLQAPPFLMLMLYRQFMFQMFIPFQNGYLNTLSGNIVTIPILPPILTKFKSQEFKFDFEIERLDSSQKKYKTHIVKFKPDNPSVKRVALDLNTLKKEDKEFSPDNIVKFVIIEDPDFNIKFPAD